MKISQDKWMEWLEIRGLSQSTINQYSDYLRRFNLKENELNQETCMAFVRRFNNNVARAFLKHLLDFVIKSDLDEAFKKEVVMIDIPRSKTRKPKKDINVLSLGEIHMIKEAMPILKYKLMVLISFYGGLRISELIGSKRYGIVGMRVYDIGWDEWNDAKDKFCPLIVKGKGKKRRKVFLPPNVAGVLKDWINKDFSLKHEKGEELFKMNERKWERLVHKYGYKALKRNVNPHLLRHSCANYLRQQGLDLEAIRKYLGHNSISTTQKYLHLTDLELEKDISSAFS